MISHCTYLLDEYALANNSILYSKFKVMNELKQIRVDDGADTIEITKKILQMEYNDGVQTIFATSHFRRRMFETPMEKIRQQYLQVQQVEKRLHRISGSFWDASFTPIWIW